MNYPQDTSYRDYTIRQVDANTFYGFPNENVKNNMFLNQTSYCKTEKEVKNLINQYYDNQNGGTHPWT